MDPSRTITVTLSGHEVHEVGAVLVTVLAHPGDGDRARSNLYASLWACVLRAQLGPCQTHTRCTQRSTVTRMPVSGQYLTDSAHTCDMSAQ